MTKRKFELPPNPIFNSEFKQRGRDNVVMIDVFPVLDGEMLRLTFECTNSPWRQGVWMSIDGYFLVNSIKSSQVDIWQDTGPSDILIECHTEKSALHLYNIWDKGSGRQSQSWSSGC